MSWDDESDDALEYDDSDHDTSEPNDILEERKSKDGLGPLDIDNPLSAYLFLSDDVQDDLQGSGKKKMKCLSCGHQFMGETYDSCPECYSSNTEESENGNYQMDDEEKHKMKCNTCGHKFMGEIYDDCPECFSADTEENVGGLNAKEDEFL